MPKKAPTARRRNESLSRDRIIEAAIELLDSDGEAGLTFRALSERLSTGSGAIYWHIANKSDLLTAACDAIVSRTTRGQVAGATPKARIRSFALGLFDAIDKHPWMGSALNQAPGNLPLVRILERLGQEICSCNVREDQRWPTVSALLSYILGVAGQNGANGQFARAHHLNRSNFLKGVSGAWLRLSPQEYPFTHSIAAQFHAHNDRTDFIAGLDLFLKGIEFPRRQKAARSTATAR